MYPSRIAEYTVAKTDQTCFNAMILSNKDVLNITDRLHFLKIIENTSMNPKCFISMYLTNRGTVKPPLMYAGIINFLPFFLLELLEDVHY